MLRTRSPLAAVTILSLVALAAVAAPAPVLAATTFTVNRVGDQPDLNLANAACDVSSNSGSQCTLRAAIQEANDTPGADTINFNITSTSKVIRPATPLPEITEGVTINGYSQPNTKVNTRQVGNNAVLKIVLDGASAGDDAIGLLVGDNVAPSVIRGLVIQHWDGTGVLLNGSGNRVAGNFIGTNEAGNAARGNWTGVATDSMLDNTIGGTSPAARNLISGNQTGIYLFGSADSFVLFNYIGTDAAGNAAVPNVTGIHVELGGAHDIGQPGAGNLISGNVQTGIELDETNGNIIRANLIGTNAAGTAALGNDGVGVYVSGVHNEIGGLAANQRNVISGNGNRGIIIAGFEGTKVFGNRIGTKADGTGDLGNETGGIWLITSDENLIGSADAGSTNLISGNGGPGVEIGGSEPTDNVVRNNAIRANDGAGVHITSGNGVNTVLANVIFSNGGDGVLVDGSARGMRISVNQIYANVGLGIDLAGGTENSAGITANDLDDPDGGANNRQNFPIITSATRSNKNGLTTIAATLNSNPSTEFRIELFIAVADPSGSGEGQIFVTAKNITTTAAGDRGFNFQLGLPAGTVVTMTATAVTAGHTSEFAANMAVVPVP